MMTRRALFAMLAAPFLPKPQALPVPFIQSFDLSRDAFTLSNGVTFSGAVLLLGKPTPNGCVQVSYYCESALRTFSFWPGNEASLRAKLQDRS